LLFVGSSRGEGERRYLRKRRGGREEPSNQFLCLNGGEKKKKISATILGLLAIKDDTTQRRGEGEKKARKVLPLINPILQIKGGKPEYPSENYPLRTSAGGRSKPRGMETWATF